MSYLNYLSPRWRILYLILTEKAVSIPQFIQYFTNQEETQLYSQLNTLTLEQILHENPDHQYTIIQYGNEPFLRIFAFLSITIPPITRTEIRLRLKHKQLNLILEELIRARIIYEYRNELSKKNYIILTEKKDEMITLLNENLIASLKNSDTTYDQSHYTMLKENQSILRYNTEQVASSPKLSLNEKKLLVNLYNDLMIKKSRKVGRSEEFIVHQIFRNNPERAKQVILSLIEKKCIKCSCKHYYYLNNTFTDNIKPVYEKNKKWVIEDLSL